MPLSACLRRQAAWLALCMVTFAAIAPVISHWIAASSGLTWMEICSVSDIKRVAVDTGSTPIPSDDHDGATHCPFCRLQQHLPALPPTAAVLLILTTVQDDAPPAIVAQPLRPRHIWAPAHSRAPPAFS